MVYFTWMKHQSIELGLVCKENPLHTERESVCWQNYDVGLLCCCCEMLYKSQAGLTLKNQIIHNLYVCFECNGNGLNIIFRYICIELWSPNDIQNSFVVIFASSYILVLITNERKVCVYCSVQKGTKHKYIKFFYDMLLLVFCANFLFLLFVVSRNNNFVLDIIQIVDSIDFMLKMLFSFLSPFCSIFNFVTMTTHDE